MAIKVLIVDDSTFFRKRLTEIIKGDPALEVCGEAKDGKEGVELTLRLHPDVITMDVEMPVMDGITAVKEIMAKAPTPILMFSSLTFEGANSTFKALEAGAVDFMLKNFDDIAHRRDDALAELRNNIKAVARSRVSRKAGPATSYVAPPSPTSSLSAVKNRVAPSTGSLASRTASSSSTLSTSRPSFGSATASTTSRTPLQTSRPTYTSPASQRAGIGSTARSVASTSAERGSSEMAYERIQEKLSNVNPGRPASTLSFSFGNHSHETTVFKRSGKRHDIIAIGSSTGGPIALQNLIPKLPKLNVPIVIIQHMPAAFTTTFAQRLNGISQYNVVEAKDGDMLAPNNCYIAPGGMQMIFERNSNGQRIRILKGDNRVVYHPCVDVSFASLAQVYGSRVLGMILTGMGSDGCEGSRLLKNAGSVIWAQNEDTCVVYGMPQAVVNAGIASQVMPLDKMAANIVDEMTP